MPLIQTNQLMDKFGKQIIDGTVSDEDLKTLLAPDTFTKSSGYVDPYVVNNANHSVLNAMQDFVQTIGPKMTDEELHKLTARLIQLTPNCGENELMRNSTLERVFLSYEMNRLPLLAEEHFKSDKIISVFSGENDIKNLKEVILMRGIEYFKNPIIVPEINGEQKNDKQQEIISELLAICKAHKKIITSSHDTDTYIQGSSGEFIPDAETELGTNRLEVIDRYISKLESGSFDDFKTDYNQSKDIFTKENDSLGKLFVNSIACVITKGFKAALLMWKEGKNAIEGTHKIDDLLSNNPNNAPR